MKKAALQILIICCGLLPMNVEADGAEPKSQLEIARVSPQIAQAGSEVAILLSERLSPKASVRVLFDDFPAQYVRRYEGWIVVLVPSELYPGSRPGITVVYNGDTSRTYQGFQVEPLEILSVVPDAAEEGSLVSIQVSRPILLVVPFVRVTFDGFPAGVEAISSSFIKVRVPHELTPDTKPVIFVHVGGDGRSKPYEDFLVKSAGLFSPQSLVQIVQRPTSVAGILISIIILVYLLVYRRKVKQRQAYYEGELERLSSEVKQSKDAVGEPIVDFPQPAPPDALAHACAGGECVLYVGAGLSARAGYPIWTEFVHNLLEWVSKNELVERTFAESLRAALRNKQFDLVADSIVGTLRGKAPQDPLYDYLREVFLEPSRHLPESHRVLRGIVFSAILTTNFDNLLEQTFEKAKNRIYTPHDTEPLLNALIKREFFILKLYGTLERPETILLAPAQYEEAVSGNRLFAEFMQSLFFSRTILFVGASLEGIEAYLEGIRFSEQISRRHYALVAVSGTAWQVKADQLLRRYGIEVLPYAPSEGHPQVQEFLENLAQKVKAEGKRTADQEQAGRKADVWDTSWRPAQLRRIHLVNIGPFDNLELNLNPRWNILLGDNGVGKSTILKAIAVGICGRDAQAYAERLIKVGRISGKIILETSDGEEYRTELIRTTHEVEVKSLPVRPLEAEGWLALGFSPLRTVSWERLRGPQPEEKERARPGSADLLPLISGEPDPRLDKVKQWIVNLDYRIKSEMSKDGDNRYNQLLKEFFRIVDRLTEGITVRFKEVDPDSYRVKVITDDGEVPIEAISQGTASLLGWIGILLQRLYEIFGRKKKPRERYALVLLDEIDAHMHPAWQQTLVPNLTELFPNVQFIATTHSPLIVGGMPIEQVCRLVRDEHGTVIKSEVEPDMTMGRTDQVLTGRLFGLDSTLDKKGTEKEIEEYQKLLSKDSRTEEEERKFERIQRNLKFRIPVPSETPTERRAQEFIEALLLEQVGEQLPEARQMVLEKAEKLLAEVEQKRKRKR